MIEKHILHFFESQSKTFMKPASEVAVLRNDHPISHAKLLLSQYKYSRVPVLDTSNHFVGVLGLNEIVDFEMAHDFYYEKSQKTPISKITNQTVQTVLPDAPFEEILHALIKEPFLPVVKNSLFMGIIARQEILKAVNAFAHDFGKYYELKDRNS